MDSTRTLVLKENFTFTVMNAEGAITEGEEGLYSYDTRFLSRYAWDFGETFQTLLAECPRPYQAVFHYAAISGPAQLVGIQRDLRITDRTLSDHLSAVNTSLEDQAVTIRLAWDSDFIDLFEARGLGRIEREVPLPAAEPGCVQYTYDGGGKFSVSCVLTVETDAPGGVWSDNAAEWKLVLKAGQRFEWKAAVSLLHPEMTEQESITYRDWELKFPIHRYEGARGRYRDVLLQAVRDLRALLLFTPRGIIPAAGIPWFAAAFGRDALLTAIMALPWYPEMAEGTLRYLAHHQGKVFDEYRAEEPGKILHEIRWGELAARKLIPHTPYYGTVDATPLFIILLHRYWKLFPQAPLLTELRPAWEAALTWMITCGDPDGDGFLEYRGTAPGKGYVVQSWKDSEDSMSRADGSLAYGTVAPVEAQGYAYRAACSAAEFYSFLGDGRSADTWREYAEDLRRRFDAAFWINGKDTYALALDGDKNPLEVQSSNAGQLLWTGIVPSEKADRLVRTLMGEELWSGWGIRTLGTAEVRYNPLSYHNGSVWPHDTALVARGMYDYGFTGEANELSRALFDLALTQRDRRLPELIGGYNRKEESPVPYPSACRPQAWDAAALLYLSEIMYRQNT